ncbi:MAG: cellobiose phosphorylase [Blautia sp.]|nr:cellobiose phosphorylase [Blautia sp.]
MMGYRFIDEHGSFELEGAENDLGLYFPLAGEDGLKSAVSPNLSGDSKLDQNHFLLEPMSIENLTNNRAGRNFWCMVKGKEPWSAVGASARQEADRFTRRQEPSKVRAGLMWHETERESAELGLSANVTSFVSIRHNVEVMHVEITNTGEEPVALTAVAAIPIYARSADNLRDHRHVTSLLHRIVTTEYGVRVCPTLSFDERGHGLNDMTYFVEGFAGEDEKPQSFYPCQDDFWGAAGTPTRPEAVCCDRPGVPAGTELNGQEALGGLRFAERELRPQESASYTVILGASWKEAGGGELMTYMGKNKVKEELELTRQYWIGKANVHYHTADENFDQFMNWVSFQPELRRIFGCSFLPHHDYGRGGRGWRDLWQDCLALLLMNPATVRQMLIGNFGGVRVDGSNATIIGDCLGEFKADRNSITRVWMDHGVWPCVTTMLYLDQTGDYGILYQKAKYFKDRQVMRGTAVDEAWNGSQWQEDARGHCYEGTVLEHLLVQMLTAFYEVGEHNHMRLRDADWNDALDMAGSRGESVAFTNAYAMNMKNLAAVLRSEAENGVSELELFEELVPLVTDRGDGYDSVQGKTAMLHTYMEQCRHSISGNSARLDTLQVAENLEGKAKWLMEHIREREWITDSQGGWYNSYYDDHGRRVEGIDEAGNVRMMLTGQVFSIMAGTATEEQISQIVRAADAYLYDEACGGYRLNTDFKELKTDMGRMFGFAFGEKENGAVFSHMAVMYANALYSRGFAKEGYKALNALYRQSMDFEKSRIYPGIPEYFGRNGRGLYHYLTGAASWYMLTVITQMFGIRGSGGGLVVQPALLAEQFDGKNLAGLDLKLLGITWKLTIENPQRLEAGSYEIWEIRLDEKTEEVHASSKTFDRNTITALDARRMHRIHVLLGAKSK